MNRKLISSLLLAASLFFVVCLASSSSSASSSTTITTTQPSKSFVEFVLNNNALDQTQHQNVTTLDEETDDEDNDDEDDEDEEYDEDEEDEDEGITITTNNSTSNNKNSSITAIARTAGWFARMLGSRSETTQMAKSRNMRTKTNLVPAASQSRGLGMFAIKALLLGPLIGLTLGKALLRGLIWAVLAYALHLFFPSVLGLLGLGTGLVGFARQMRPDYAQMIVHTLINLHDEFHRLPPVNVDPNSIKRHY